MKVSAPAEPLFLTAPDGLTRGVAMRESDPFEVLLSNGQAIVVTLIVRAETRATKGCAGRLSKRVADAVLPLTNEMLREVAPKVIAMFDQPEEATP